jgi:hypothetical protein
MYVTYCVSPWQTPTDKPLPPQQLHLSNLVMYVYQLAKDDGAEFAVISPYPYGLVSSTECVPHHPPMSEKDDELLLELIEKQMEEKGISSIDFWVVAAEYLDTNHPLHKYEMLLQQACTKLGKGFNLRKVKEPLGSIKQDIPSPVRPENVEIGGPHSMNKKAGPTYILRAQDENGIWKDVRKSSFLPDLQIKARTLAKKFPAQKVEIVEAPNDGRQSF